MKTIEEIQSELRTLAHELEELKESRSAGEREIDFERLSIDGSHKPITPHPLENYDEYAQKCYLTMLLTVARFDDDKLPVSLLFAHRLAFGMRYLIKGENLQEEYIAAQTLSYKQLDDLVEVFKGTDERLMLILECMLTAGMFGKGKKDAIDYIVQLSQLLELSRDDMVFLSNMAAVILTQDLNAYKCDVQNKYEFFDCYLKLFEFEVNVVIEAAIANYKNVTLTPEALDNIEKVFNETIEITAMVGNAQHSIYYQNIPNAYKAKVDDAIDLLERYNASAACARYDLSIGSAYMACVYEKYQKIYGTVDIDFITDNYSEITKKIPSFEYLDQYFKVRESLKATGYLLYTFEDDFEEIFLEGNILNFKYDRNSAKIYSQEVSNNFILLSEAKDIKPNCPVGVEAHPLTPFSLIEKKYNDAWERFRKSQYDRGKG